MNVIRFIEQVPIINSHLKPIQELVFSKKMNLKKLDLELSLIAHDLDYSF